MSSSTNHPNSVSFEHFQEGFAIRFSMEWSESFPVFQITQTKISTNKLIFSSNKLILPQSTLEALAEYMLNGDPLLNIHRLEFKDLYRSYMIIFHGRTQLILKTFNLLNEKMEELHLTNLNRDDFYRFLIFDTTSNETP